MLLWAMGMVWILHRKGVVTTSRDDTKLVWGESAANEGELEANYGEEPVSEIVLDRGVEEQEAEARARARRAAAEVETPEPTTGEEPQEQGPPTYPVWFESVRDIGVCKIRYEGGSKTANLHVDARLPEGKLSFSYTCGPHSGRGSIRVKPNRVNGVLFCKEPSGVTVKTVRSKEGRCGR